MTTLRFRTGGPTRLRVDREAGTIHDVAVISLGTTKPSADGSGPFGVDTITLQQVASAINRAGRVKSRVTHPELAGEDAIDRLAGYFTNARVEGGKVLADFHAGAYAQHSPSGNVRAFLLGLAEEAPGDAGVSIVTTNFTLEPADTPAGVALRVASIDAIDWVGEPAANPAGMLSASFSGETTMKFTDRQMQLLKVLGLPDGDDAESFYNNLAEENRQLVDALGDPTAAGDDPAPDPVAAGARPVPGLALAERKRVQAIYAAAHRAGLSQGWARRHVEEGTDTATVLTEALQRMTAGRSPDDMPTTRVTLGADRNGDTVGAAISDALALRFGALKNPHPRAAEFRGRTLIEVGRVWLAAAGVREAHTMSGPQIAARLMRSRQLALAQATGDFPSLLADALGKSLRAEYAEYPSTWQAWAGRRTTADFKPIKRPALHSFPTPIEIPEGEEYTFTTLAESNETYQLATYGHGTILTRQAIINDDLGAFDRIPRMAATSCRRLEDDLVYAQLTANPAMTEDNVALFATAHANIGSGIITNANVSAGRVLMAKQTDLKGTVLNLRPAHLLVPVEKEDEARALVAAQELRSTESDATYVTNTYSFLKSLGVVSEPRLSADSNVQWYLAASAKQIDTVEVAFLEGEEVPVVEEEDDFDTDARRMKVRHTVAARAIDFRGLYRSSGS